MTVSSANTLDLVHSLKHIHQSEQQSDSEYDSEEVDIVGGEPISPRDLVIANSEPLASAADLELGSDLKQDGPSGESEDGDVEGSSDSQKSKKMKKKTKKKNNKKKRKRQREDATEQRTKIRKVAWAHMPGTDIGHADEAVAPSPEDGTDGQPPQSPPVPSHINVKESHLPVRFLESGARNIAMVGSGGCAALALAHLPTGLGGTKEEVAKKLDRGIQPLADEFDRDNAKRGQLPRDPQRTGVHGEEWHIELIRRTVVQESKGRVLLKKQKVTTDGGCLALNATDHFLIDGTLNRSYTWNKHTYYQPGHDVAGPEDAWRHCIALSKGKVYCAGLHQIGLSVLCLRLDTQGRPERTTGYMKRIKRVYKVEGPSTSRSKPKRKQCRMEH